MKGFNSILGDGEYLKCSSTKNRFNFTACPVKARSARLLPIIKALDPFNLTSCMSLIERCSIHEHHVLVLPLAPKPLQNYGLTISSRE